MTTTGPHLGHWLLAEKLLGRPVPMSEPYPCLRREVGYRHCGCDNCNRKPAAAAAGLPEDEFAKLLASVTGPQPTEPVEQVAPNSSPPAPPYDPTVPTCPRCGNSTVDRFDEGRDVCGPCREYVTEDVATAVKRICRTHSESSARSQQKQIGLSEIGDPCDRAVAYRLFETPAVNTERDNHLADVGTAWHTWVAAAFEAENQRLGRRRYVIEERVYLTDGYSGTADLFDIDTGSVLDHKLLGITSLRKIRQGDIPDKYRVQLHSYGYGHARAGREVREVALVCYPRSDNLNGDFGGLGLHIHTEAYDEQIALQGLDRLGELSALLHQLDPEQHPDRWSLIPATSGESCRYCPFFRPQGGPADASGCPGVPVDVPSTMPGVI